MPEAVPFISPAAIRKAAEALYIDTHLTALFYSEEQARARWARATEAEQAIYEARARRTLTAAHDEIAGPAWAIGHDDGQTNQISEFLPDTVTRPRRTNPYPYTLETA